MNELELKQMEREMWNELKRIWDSMNNLKEAISLNTDMLKILNERIKKLENK
jgi:hypothetical protein